MIIRHQRAAYACLQFALAFRLVRSEASVLLHHALWPRICFRPRIGSAWSRILSTCSPIADRGHPSEDEESAWTQDAIHLKVKEGGLHDSTYPSGEHDKRTEQLRAQNLGGTTLFRIKYLINELQNAQSEGNKMDEGSQAMSAVEACLKKWDRSLNNSAVQRLMEAFKQDAGFALAIFEWARSQPGFKPSKFNLGLLINITGRAKDFRQMKKLVGEFSSIVGEPPGVVVYTDVMKSYALDERFDDMIAVYRTMLKEGVEPSVMTYSVVIGGLATAGRVELAMDLRKEMETLGVKPNAHVYGDLIALCGKTRPERAEALLEEMKAAGMAPTVYHFNRVLAIQLENGQHENALSLFQRMVGGEASPNRVTYVILLDFFAKRGMVKEAKDLLHDIWIRKTVGLEAKFYNVLINMYVQHRRLEDAKAAYADMLAKGVRPDNVTHSTLIFGLLKADKYEETLAAIDAMQKRRMEITLLGYTAMLNLCSRCQSKEGVVKIVECMEACKHRCHDLLLLALGPQVERSDYWEEVGRRLDELVFEDPVSRKSFVDGLITCLLKIGLKSRAGRIWKEARNRGLLDRARFETSSAWVLDLHNFGPAAAEIALCLELLGLWQRLQNDEDVPAEIRIVTGWGRAAYATNLYAKKNSTGWGHGSYTDHMYMKMFLNVKLRDLSSPFCFNPNGGYFVAGSASVWRWLQDSLIREQLRLRDG